ncbi:MAG: hypothetical protein KGN39_01710 [Betaproteobacteria bacterium]|nr:hypothetical protein [Betaproteobacteria bacterium]
MSAKIKSLGANKTEVHLSSGAVVFVSYSTPVAAQLAGGGFIRTAEKYSVTTSKHITQWLDGRKAAVVPQATLDAML